MPKSEFKTIDDVRKAMLSKQEKAADNDHMLVAKGIEPLAAAVLFLLDEVERLRSERRDHPRS